jgi:hypothetical protein
MARAAGYSACWVEVDPGRESESDVDPPETEGGECAGPWRGTKTHGRIGHRPGWQRPVGATDSSAEQSLEGDCFSGELLSVVSGNGGRGEATDPGTLARSAEGGLGRPKAGDAASNCVARTGYLRRELPCGHFGVHGEIGSNPAGLGPMVRTRGSVGASRTSSFERRSQPS